MSVVNIPKQRADAEQQRLQAELQSQIEEETRKITEVEQQAEEEINGMPDVEAEADQSSNSTGGTESNSRTNEVAEVAEYKGVKIGLTDHQGNPVNSDGSLLVEKVKRIDELSDEDFVNPIRNVQLPTLPKRVDAAIGANGKPVVIKKNIFEKNRDTHGELTPNDNREILKRALYNPNLIGSSQPIRRPDYKVAIQTGDMNAVVVLDVFAGKDNVEIVGWRKVDAKGLEKMKRQAEREGGQFLILSPDEGSAAALSALPSDVSSADKNTKKFDTDKENLPKNAEADKQQEEKQKIKHHKATAQNGVSEKEVAMRDALVEKVRESRIVVGTNNEDTQRVLDWANGKALTKGLRLALNDKRNGSDNTPTAISNNANPSTWGDTNSISDAKIDKLIEITKENAENLNSLAKTIQNNGSLNPKEFLLALEVALGSNNKNPDSSQYFKNDIDYTLRLANHRANAVMYLLHDHVGGNTSVVVKMNERRFYKHNEVEAVEHVYFPDKLDQQAQLSIIEGIQNWIKTGEYNQVADQTNVSTIQNGIREHRVYHGSGAEFEAFDHSHMGNEKDAQITDRIRFFRTPNGEAYGFTVGGKIYIDTRIATAETPIHEYSHLWAQMLREQNPKEWANIVSLMKGTPIWDEIKGIYTELKTDDEIADEVLAHYSGKRGAEMLRAEEAKVKEGNTPLSEKIKAIGAIERVRKALHKFWKGVADTLGIHFTTAEEVADRVMYDLLSGLNPNIGTNGNSKTRFQFIGEKGAMSLDEAAEATIRFDNLNVAREMEDAFNEKKKRIEKLWRSEPVIVEGNEYMGKYELNSKSAGNYILNSLRKGYKNTDTNELIHISRKSQKVAHHDAENEVHLKSIAYIPQLIEHAIFIDEIPNSKSKNGFDSYRYYIVGFNIGGVDYTVRLTVGVKNGQSYYDHSLTKIEKGNLINLTNGVKADVSEKETAISNGKDKRLLSLLQVDEQENARKIKFATGWERGADGKWRYEVMDGEMKDGWEKKANRIQGVELSEIIDNKPLFDAYPKLKDYTLTLERLSNGVYG